jgi:surface antigen
MPTMQTWLTINHPYLCRITVGAHTFSRTCTTHWYLDGLGNVLSDDPNWASLFDVEDLGVPRAWPHDSLGILASRSRRTVPLAKVVKPAKAKLLRQAKPYVQPAAPKGIGLWTPPPGHPAYALADYAGDPNAAYYGTCTWYAEYRRRDEPLNKLGNAAQWAWNAVRYGLRTGTKPVVGATVVFQPGVLGAGSGGHVGHVEAVYSGGWFLISEMNMSWNGGGFGRVSFRYVVAMPGVSFVY